MPDIETNGLGFLAMLWWTLGCRASTRFLDALASCAPRTAGSAPALIAAMTGRGRARAAPARCLCAARRGRRSGAASSRHPPRLRSPSPVSPSFRATPRTPRQPLPFSPICCRPKVRRRSAKPGCFRIAMQPARTGRADPARRRLRPPDRSPIARAVAAGALARRAGSPNKSNRRNRA